MNKEIMFENCQKDSYTEEYNSLDEKILLKMISFYLKIQRGEHSILIIRQCLNPNSYFKTNTWDLKTF